MATIQRLKNSWPLLAVALVLPLSANAADVQLAGELGVGYTDNIQATPTAGRSEVIERLGTQFSVQENSRRLTADVAGDLAYQNYSHNTYPGQLLGNIRASTLLHVVQDRFDWVLEDDFGQTQRDLFTILTPADYEHVNYFSTGPNVALNLFSSATRLHLEARYTRVDYETSPYGSERYGGRLGIERELSSASNVSINISDERVEPEPLSGVASYDRQEGYGRYELRAPRTLLSLDAGLNRIDQTGRTDSGPLLRFRLSRQVGGLSTISIEAGREFSDSGSLLASGGRVALVAGLGPNTLSQTANPFVNKYARLGWDMTGRRTIVRLWTVFADENYTMQPSLDRKQIVFAGLVSRQFNAKLTGHLNYSYERNDFSTGAGDSRNKIAAAGLTWTVGRRLSVDLSTELYRSFYQTDGHIDENRFWLRLRYGDAVRSVSDVGRVRAGPTGLVVGPAAR